MPPNSTQNLNAKLSATPAQRLRLGAGGIKFAPSAIQTYAPPVRIVGAAASYRGGYHLNV
jgi:hypothetical protein